MAKWNISVWTKVLGWSFNITIPSATLLARLIEQIQTILERKT